MSGYKLILGRLYFDTRCGQRQRILSLEIEWNAARCAVVQLPIVSVFTP